MQLGIAAHDVLLSVMRVLLVSERVYVGSARS